MIIFSYFLGREVRVRFKDSTKVTGYLDKYKDDEYYIVLRDGSRMFFQKHRVYSIEYV